MAENWMGNIHSGFAWEPPTEDVPDGIYDNRKRLVREKWEGGRVVFSVDAGTLKYCPDNAALMRHIPEGFPLGTPFGTFPDTPTS